MTLPRRVLLTYQDYAELPADGRRYEILEGELAVNPAPNPNHQRCLGRLHVLTWLHATTHGLGEVLMAPLDVILDEFTIVQPDLVYLDPSRAGQVSERGIEGPPTLVVEVLSPSTARVDRVRKRQLYARFGVPYYWIVAPDNRSVEAYALEGEDYRLLATATGRQPVGLAPFPSLELVPESLWD